MGPLVQNVTACKSYKKWGKRLVGYTLKMFSSPYKMKLCLSEVTALTLVTDWKAIGIRLEVTFLLFPYFDFSFLIPSYISIIAISHTQLSMHWMNEQSATLSVLGAGSNTPVEKCTPPPETCVNIKWVEVQVDKLTNHHSLHFSPTREFLSVWTLASCLGGPEHQDEWV